MNFGTRIRVILAVATALNTANVMSAFAEFDNPIVSTIYKAISLVALVIVLSANTYYNNDFTPEGQTGTQIAREMKELRDFETEYVEEPEDAEVIDDDNC